jgi:phosphatidylglycerol:prolipoprotein diacylglycerol transferase
MYRVLISSPHIGSYSAMLLVGFVFGWWLARRRAKREGIEPRHIDNLTLLITVTSLFGARLFSWWFYFPPGYSFWTAMTMGGGGMVFYGGLIFGMICLFAYTTITRVSLLNLFDVFAPSAALGLVFGRVGCFMAGCCWGDLCVNRDAVHLPDPRLEYQLRTVPAISREHFPLAVTFPPEAGAYEQHSDLGLLPPGAARSLPVHPVQLYEAALALALAIYLHRSFRRRKWSGEIGVKLVLGYAIIRFGIEFLRADNSPIYWGMTLSQTISLLLAAACIAFLRWRVRVPLMVLADSSVTRN